MQRIIAIMIALLGWLQWSALAAAEKRVALVIGNSKYLHARQLPNATHDSDDMKAALQTVGFDVMSGRDLTLRDFARLVREFRLKAESADVALFFYAGHGFEAGGQNYLIPVESDLATDGAQLTADYNLKGVMDALQNVRGISIVLLDACRNDPALSAPIQRGAAQLRGLDRVTARGQQYIAFATEPGRTAADGAGRNSPFTAALLKHVATPGIELELMMKRVFEDVRTETKQKQVPWQHSSLTKPFMFKSGGGTGAAAQSRPSQVVSAAALIGQCDDLYLEAQRAVDRVRGFGPPR